MSVCPLTLSCEHKVASLFSCRSEETSMAQCSSLLLNPVHLAWLHNFKNEVSPDEQEFNLSLGLIA